FSISFFILDFLDSSALISSFTLFKFFSLFSNSFFSIPYLNSLRYVLTKWKRNFSLASLCWFGRSLSLFLLTISLYCWIYLFISSGISVIIISLLENKYDFLLLNAASNLSKNSMTSELTLLICLDNLSISSI